MALPSTSLSALAGPESRMKASKMVLQRLYQRAQPGALVFVVGDFNTKQHQEAYQTLTGHVYSSNASTPIPDSDAASNVYTCLDASKELYDYSSDLTARTSASLGLFHGRFGESYTNPGFPEDELEPKNIDYILYLDNGAVTSGSGTEQQWCAHVLLHFDFSQLALTPDRALPFKGTFYRTASRLLPFSVRQCFRITV